MDTEIDANDRLSQLPETITHHILSFLPTEDVARISVLSKRWHCIWISFPMWDFSGSLLGLPRSKDYEETDRMIKFLKFVEKSLVRQCNHHSCIPRFRISMTLKKTLALCHIANLVGRALRFGVKEPDIKLNVERSLHIAYMLQKENGIFDFKLPKRIFSTKTLQVLRLCRCYFKLPLHYTSLIWPYLEELSLEFVAVDDELIQNLVSYCPFIKKFALLQCMGLSKLELSGFTRLKEVEVRDWCNTRIRKIKIDLLSLQAFYYRGEIPESHIDLIACEDLKILKLSSNHLTERVCEDLVSKLPRLKSLKLGRSLLRRVSISSRQLESLDLSNLKGAIIDAPNLVSFNYHGSSTILPSGFSMHKSRLERISNRAFHWKRR